MTSLARSVSIGPESRMTRRRSSRSTGSMGRSKDSVKVPMLMDAPYRTHAPATTRSAQGEPARTGLGSAPFHPKIGPPRSTGGPGMSPRTPMKGGHGQVPRTRGLRDRGRLGGAVPVRGRPVAHQARRQPGLLGPADRLAGSARGPAAGRAGPPALRRPPAAAALPVLGGVPGPGHRGLPRVHPGPGETPLPHVLHHRVVLRLRPHGPGADDRPGDRLTRAARPATLSFNLPARPICNHPAPTPT